jgi:hypothetical protein
MVVKETRQASAKETDFGPIPTPALTGSGAGRLSYLRMFYCDKAGFGYFFAASRYIAVLCASNLLQN